MAGCRQPAAEPLAPPVPVVVVTPEAGSTPDAATRYPATIARDREATLSFRIGGVVRALPIRIGERIGIGSQIARLDGTPYQVARVRAEADVARLARARARSHELVPAGAVAPSVDEDNASALDAARAVLRNARYDEDSAQIRSPFAGVVLTRQVEVGETVTTGQAVARVADLNSALLARAAVPQAIAATIHDGDAALVMAGQVAPLPARVRHVGAAADARTGAVDIELTLPAGAGLPSGLTASVAFAPGATARQVQRLPPEALLDAAHGQGHVYVVDVRRGVAHRVAVRLLGFDGEALRVAGLDPTARVITDGAGFVHDGERVAVVRQ